MAQSYGFLRLTASLAARNERRTVRRNRLAELGHIAVCWQEELRTKLWQIWGGLVFLCSLPWWALSPSFFLTCLLPGGRWAPLFRSGVDARRDARRWHGSYSVPLHLFPGFKELSQFDEESKWWKTATTRYNEGLVFKNLTPFNAPTTPPPPSTTSFLFLIRISAGYSVVLRTRLKRTALKDWAAGVERRGWKQIDTWSGSRSKGYG